MVVDISISRFGGSFHPVGVYGGFKLRRIHPVSSVMVRSSLANPGAAQELEAGDVSSKYDSSFHS